jgi:hypothetical protein
MLTWAEDRALLRSTPSADPGAKTGARAEHTSALRSLVDRSTTAPGLAPMRQTFAARCRDIQATMPLPIHLRQSDEIPFHGEPRHQLFSWDSHPASIPADGWPTLAEVITRLGEQQQRMTLLVESLSVESLSEPAADHPDMPIRFAMIHALHDEACHCGEIHLLRKLQRRM